MKVSFKLLLCFVLLFLSRSEDSLAQNLDERIVQNWNTQRDLRNDNLFLNLSQSADYTAIGTPVIMLTAGLLKDDPYLKKKGLQSGIALVGTYGIGYLMKKGIKRERPFVSLANINPIQFKDSYSMPSGSTSVAFATATSLTSAFPKWYVAVPSYGYASAVGYARIRSGEHYPSDVLLGAVVGAASVWVSGKLMKWVNK